MTDKKNMFGVVQGLITRGLVRDNSISMACGFAIAYSLPVDTNPETILEAHITKYENSYGNFLDDLFGYAPFDHKTILKYMHTFYRLRHHMLMGLSFDGSSDNGIYDYYGFGSVLSFVEIKAMEQKNSLFWQYVDIFKGLFNAYKKEAE